MDRIGRSRARIHEVTTDGEYTGGNDDSPALVREKAVQQALAQAVKEAVAVDVKSRFFHSKQVAGATNRQILENFNALISDGTVLSHEIVDEKCVVANRSMSCSVRVRAAVLDRRGRRDTGFEVRVTTDRSVFKSGEEARVSLTSTRDGFVLLLMQSGDEISILLPNAYQSAPRIKAGEPLVFPSSALTDKGIRLRAELPAGVASAQESLKLYVTRQPLALVAGAASSGPFKTTDVKKNDLVQSLYAELARIDQDAWAEAQTAYTIERRP